jgi:hypothetical protein
MFRRAFVVTLLLIAATLVAGGCGSGGLLRSVGFRGVPPQSEPPLDEVGPDR